MSRHAQGRIRTTLALAALAALLAGCTSAENNRFRFGNAGPLPVFQPAADTLADPAPSVTGLDRSGWAPIALDVPVHGTAHRPTYAPSAFDLDTTARQRGQYPTAETCLDLGEPDDSDEIRLAAATHGLAVVDAALLIPRIIIRPPNATDWSPTLSYARVPGRCKPAAACCAACCETPCDASPAPDSEPGDAETPSEPAAHYDATDGFFDEADALDEPDTTTATDAS